MNRSDLQQSPQQKIRMSSWRLSACHRPWEGRTALLTEIQLNRRAVGICSSSSSGAPLRRHCLPGHLRLCTHGLKGTSVRKGIGPQKCWLCFVAKRNGMGQLFWYEFCWHCPCRSHCLVWVGAGRWGPTASLFCTTVWWTLPETLGCNTARVEKQAWWVSCGTQTPYWAMFAEWRGCFTKYNLVSWCSWKREQKAVYYCHTYPKFRLCGRFRGM
jgi:hypothetical protein